MLLFVIRHGETEGNVRKLYYSQMDLPLTDKGRQQALALRPFLQQYTFDRVYASDLLRAFDTAKASADRLGLTVTADPQLREIYAGEWEGVPFEKLHTKGEEALRIWQQDIGRAICPGGESTAELQKRFVAALDRIARENVGRTVLIGTHATPVRVLMCHCMGKPIEFMQQIPWVSNASVTTVVWEDDVFTLELAGFAEHLKDLCTTLPNKI
jgi:broad specificity phosphatase PhoE